MDEEGVLPHLRTKSILGHHYIPEGDDIADAYEALRGNRRHKPLLKLTPGNLAYLVGILDEPTDKRDTLLPTPSDVALNVDPGLLPPDPQREFEARYLARQAAQRLRGPRRLQADALGRE